MIKNYLLAAIGSARKNGLGLAVNLFGLAMSLSALVVIILFVQRELEFDTTHPDADRIYRVIQIIDSGSYIENSSSSPYPVMDALVEDYPDDIEMAVRIFDFQIPEKSMKLANNELFLETGIYYADSNFFRMFDFPLTNGDQNSVLSKPFSMVISEELAQKWFKDEDPIGQTVMLGGHEELSCEVTGVFSPGGPSHIQPNAVVSMSTTKHIAPWMSQNWVWNPCWTYIKLKEQILASDFESKLPGFVEKNYPDFNRGTSSHHLQPITDIHLHSKLEFEMSPNSDMKYLYIFISCAIFLLIIAAINFINLNSIYFLQRIREIGVRKLVGATIPQLNRQFMIESVFMTLTGFVLSLILLAVFHPVLESYLGLQISWSVLFDPKIILMLLLTVLVLGGVAGYLPARMVSASGISQIFKGGLKGNSRGKTLRKSLVVFQFGLAISVMIFSMMAGRQLNYMQTRNNGFDASNVLTMRITTTPVQVQFQAFKNELLSHPGIVQATVLNEILGINNNNHEFRYGDMKEDEWKYFPSLMVEEDFLNTFNIKMVAGRPYSHDYQNEDSLSIVINQSMAEFMGFNDPADAIGESLVTVSGTERVIGVTENFNFKTLHHPVGPFVLDIPGKAYDHHIHFAKYTAIKVADMSPEVLEHIETVWKKFVQNAPFDYHVLEDDLVALYKSESRMSKVLGMFSLLCIIIACLGLFALTWFMSQAKARELAVRQTLGASFPQLIQVATKEQMAMVSLAILLAIPVSIFGISRWLQSFAFRIEHEPLVYILASLLAFLIAFATIFYLAWKVSVRNPAEVLKYE